MATAGITPLEQRLLDAVRVRGEMHGRHLANELGADSGAVARCLLHLEELRLLCSETIGRTKLYRVRTEREATQETVLEAIEGFDDPAPIAVLPSPGGAAACIVVVLPGAWVGFNSWLALRRIARRFTVPVELLIYPEHAARRLAHLPGNPVREALKAYPERGARLMEPRAGAGR